jgi:branched-chain amino acid transport system permease protein
MSAPSSSVDFQSALLRKARWRPLEFVVWAVAFALPLAMPSHSLLVNEIAIVALFAMSLDLILGYTGIVSLGHAAFFGFGAYAAALFAKLVMPDPTVGLVVATVLSAVLGLVASVTILRGSDLTRLMVTLGTALLLLELANKLDWLTGGADGLQGVVMGPVLGLFDFDLYGRTAAWYSLAVMLVLFLLMRRLVHSPFGATLKAIRDNRLRAMAIGIPVVSRLATVYTIAAGVAGAAGALLAQTTGFRLARRAGLRPLGRRAADAGHRRRGWLYGGVAGAIVFKLLQTWLSAVTPQYWMFWIGLILVLLVLVGRDRLLKPWTWFGLAGKKKGGAA